MSINGVSASTLGPNNDRAASSDGVDDFAESTAPVGDGPESLPSNETFGIAFVFNAPVTGGSDEDFFGLASNKFRVFDNSNVNTDGSIDFALIGSNSVIVSTQGKFVDGETHLCVINKRGNTASDMSFFVDDMQTKEPVVVDRDNGFDHTQYSAPNPLSVFAATTFSGQASFKEYTTTFLEFNEEPYSATDRLELKKRALGV
jgi:hypothetical protein